VNRSQIDESANLLKIIGKTSSFSPFCEEQGNWGHTGMQKEEKILES